jgi:hypothetical protein
MTVDNIELYLRLVPGSRVTVVPEVLAHCRDHDGPRASDHTTSRDGAAELSALLDVYADELDRWPAEHADLLCRAALRWAGVDHSIARLYFRRSLATAPGSRLRARLARLFLPTYARSRARQLRPTTRAAEVAAVAPGPIGGGPRR